MDNVNSGYLNRFKSFPLMAFSCETKDWAKDQDNQLSI
jgi:hypothetical protein